METEKTTAVNASWDDKAYKAQSRNQALYVAQQINQGNGTETGHILRDATIIYEWLTKFE